MCYHVLHLGGQSMKPNRIGVRELRQNLSRYLRRGGAGGRSEVTERTLPVAILAPLPGQSSAVERLTAAGKVVPARLDLLKLGPPPDRPRERAISEALAEQRREGRGEATGGLR